MKGSRITKSKFFKKHAPVDCFSLGNLRKWVSTKRICVLDEEIDDCGIEPGGSLPAQNQIGVTNYKGLFENP